MMTDATRPLDNWKPAPAGDYERNDYSIRIIERPRRTLRLEVFAKWDGEYVWKLLEWHRLSGWIRRASGFAGNRRQAIKLAESEAHYY